MDQDERKYRKVGLIISFGVHVCVALLFFFLLAWREPNPPLPEYGIELNFGTDNTGSGQTPQPVPTKKVTPTPPIKNEVKEPEPEEEKVEEVQEEVIKEEAAKVTQPQESVVEQKEKTPTPPVKQPAVEKKTPVTQNEAKEIDKRSEYPLANQGDDTNKPGDKGKEEGKIDERAMYGAKGKAEGTSLEMTGWKLDFDPKPNDPTSENGIIVFQITIDEEGYIINVKTLEKTVSPRVEKIYREAVEQLSFSKTSDNIRPAPTSTGKITFVIKSK